jgi:hypothetical protein
MKFYLQKSTIKSFLISSGLIFSVIILLTLAINIFLSKSRAAIEKELDNCLGKKFSIKRITYLPPHFITVSDITISDISGNEKKPAFFVPKTKLTFDLKKIINRKGFIFTKITFNNTKINQTPFNRFLKENKEKIKIFIESLSKDDPIIILLKNTSLISPQKDNSHTNFNINAALKINSKYLISFGSINPERVFFKEDKLFLKHYGQPLLYNFKGLFIGNNFIIDKAEIKKEKVYSKFWGMLKNDTLRLNGFLCETGPADQNIFKKLNLDDADKFALTYGCLLPNENSPKPPSYLNIFDINCLLKLAIPDIQIENITFTYKNTPLRIKGNLSLLDPNSLNLVISSYPPEFQSTAPKHQKRFEVKLGGNFQEEEFTGNLTIELFKNIKDKNPSQKLDTLLKNLSFSFTEKQNLKLYCQQADVSYTTEDTSYKLEFTDFTNTFDLKDDQIKLAKFKSLLYDGTIEGESKINIGNKPIQCSSDINIKGVSAEKLNFLLDYFSKVYGTMDSKIHYTNSPSSNLRGTITIHNGYLDQFEFFKWLAKTFKLPSLKKLDFKKLSMEFIVDDESAKLDNINLEAKDVAIDGYFTLQENDLVSSKISIALSRELMETSKFRSLARSLDEDITSLSLDFQLSGLFNTMNFQWLDSLFKEKMQDRIPNFIERGIEKRLEIFIQSIYENGESDS